MPNDYRLLNEKGQKINDYTNYLKTDENAFQILLSKAALLIGKKDSLQRSNIIARETDCDFSVTGNWEKFSRFEIFYESIFLVIRRDNNRNIAKLYSGKSIL